MLTKRIIPCLDIKDGRTVKGTHFTNLRDAGDPVELAKNYVQQGADELVFLDIAATNENRKTLLDLVQRIAFHVTIPFTVGGGIRSVADVANLLEAGADKISINSSAVQRPDLIDELANAFGSQCVVVAIDARKVENQWLVHTHGGQRPTDKKLFSWAREAENRGAGEILFTSMDHDGTKRGFANDTLAKLNEWVQVPVIASGGAGHATHFLEAFLVGHADATLAASVFHYQEINIRELKKFLAPHVPIRL